MTSHTAPPLPAQLGSPRPSTPQAASRPRSTSAGAAGAAGFTTTLLLILVCSLADWALTRDAIALGLANEANPVAGWMLAQGDLTGLLLKMGVVGAGCLSLWLLRRHMAAQRAARLGAACYVAVVVYQALARLVIL